MTMKTVQTLSQEFANASLKAFEARLKGKLKGIDDAHDEITEIYCQLRDMGDDGIAALKRLTEHNNIGVRVRAAAKYLWIDIPHAMGVLEKDSENWERHPVHTIERAAGSNASIGYRLVAQRGEPIGTDPYIKWKEKQQAKEQKQK